MKISEIWNYDYDSRCDCSEDDRCGCSFPSNMARGFVTQRTVPTNCSCTQAGETASNSNAARDATDNAAKIPQSGNGTDASDRVEQHDAVRI